MFKKIALSIGVVGLLVAVSVQAEMIPPRSKVIFINEPAAAPSDPSAPMQAPGQNTPTTLKAGYQAVPNANKIGPMVQPTPGSLKKGGACYMLKTDYQTYACDAFVMPDGQREPVTIREIYNKGWRVTTSYVSQFDNHFLFIEEQ